MEKQYLEGVSAIHRKLSFGQTLQTLELRNFTDKEISVGLMLVGSKRFSLPKRFQQFTIKPKLGASVPVELLTHDKNVGWPMAKSTVYKGGIQVWGTDPKNKVLFDIISLSASGPARVPILRCMEPVEFEQKKPGRRNSPPSITISATKPGTTLPKNTGTVEISWRIDGADEMWDLWSYPGAEVLDPGSFTDAGGWTDSEHVTPSSSTFTYTAGGTAHLTLFARNPDGEVWQGETIYYKARVGYHNARCPAGGTIHTDELDQIRTYLDNIDGLLRANALENLPGFVEEWNRSCPGALSFPEFDDMDYLSGSVGSGSLADDILTSMRDVLIYVKPNTMPRGYRPGTTSGDVHALCERWVCTPEGLECWSAGRTYYSATDPDCNWIAICFEDGADDLTLLHELYHYAAGSGDEMKAVAVSCCAFDYIPC